MRPFPLACLHAARQCARGVLTLVLWTVWLVLAVLLAFQIYIASKRELEVPPSLLRSFEQRLADSGVHATFGRTTFDPSGRVLVENVRATLPAFSEPIATARALYVRLDPWALVFGRFEEVELQATGVSLFVPAMLSTSGRSEELVRNLDATLMRGDHEITVAQLTCQVGPLPVSAHGIVHFTPRRTGQTDRSLPIAEFLAHKYPPLSRQIADAVAQLSVLEEPHLHLGLTPSESRGAIAEVVLTARSLRLPSPALHTGPLLLTTRLPLLGDQPVRSRLALTAESVSLTDGSNASRVRAVVRGTLRPGTFGFEVRDADISASELRLAGTTLETPAVRLTAGPLPRLRAELTTRLAGQPLYANASADLGAKTADVDFSGRVDDGLLALISTRIGRDVRQWIDFPEPVTITAARATFAAGWQWEKLQARLVVPIINAYHIALTDGRVALELTPTRLYAPEAFARIGENFARGTYEHDPATNRYRFLLDGQLRPLAISGWFTAWWPDFFEKLVFNGPVPTASVEVAGRWGKGTGGESREIVFAETTAPEIFGAKFDHARVRLFIRPHFLDALEFAATLGPGEAHGTFTRRIDPVSSALESLDFDVTSNIDPTGPAGMFGTAGKELLAPFFFERPPSLKIRGHLDGPAAPGGAHETVDVTGRSDGKFRFHDFPLDHVALNVALRDDAITLDNVDAGFAGGSVKGRAKVWGRDAERRLGFDLRLHDASLGYAIAITENYTAAQKGAPTPAPNRFLKEKSNVRLDLNASAEGPYDNAFGFRGEGNAALQGAELGEVKLLGLLSDLFSFTALRFTTARAEFRIDGPRFVFSEVSLTGANSAINGHGTYALDRRELDFNAKIFPFQESNPGLKSIVGAVLSPLSNVFEVKLTGSLDQPAWRFLIGPTSFLHNLTQGSAPETPAPLLSPLARPPAPAPANP